MPENARESFAHGRLILETGRISRLTINAPAVKNAMANEMWDAIPVIVERTASDPSIRTLILTGAGGAFCAGADIGEFEAIYASADSALAANNAIRVALEALRAMPVPVIAAVTGPCVGGGVALTLACDHVIADADSIYAIPPARLGIAYSAEDTSMLLERLSPPRAKEMLMSARRLSASEALAWGLIDRVVQDPLAAAEAYAADLCELSGASILQTKRTINALAPRSVSPSIRNGFAALFHGPDFIEGRTAFLGRRKPRF